MEIEVRAKLSKNLGLFSRHNSKDLFNVINKSGGESQYWLGASYKMYNSASFIEKLSRRKLNTDDLLIFGRRGNQGRGVVDKTAGVNFSKMKVAVIRWICLEPR